MIHATVTWCHPIAVGFLGITKNAHTSILTSLLMHGCGDRYQNRQIDQKWQTPKYQIPYWTFSFLRNPFDRLVSAWAYKVRVPSQEDKLYWRLADQYGAAMPVGMPFPDFVRLLYCTPPLQWDRHFQPQIVFLAGRHLDFLGRVETIRDDWRVVERHAGRDLPLPVTRKSRRDPDYRQYYDPDTRRMVEKMYAEDLSAFAYQF